MSYRIQTYTIAIADDSNLSQLEVNRSVTITQSKDRKTFNSIYLVNPTDAETQIAFPTVTTVYNVSILSDQPIRYRFNGPSATQFTFNSNNVAAVNYGAPAPDMCVCVMTANITSLYLAPIIAATQLATVKIIITGDPLNPYT